MQTVCLRQALIKGRKLDLLVIPVGLQWAEARAWQGHQPQALPVVPLPSVPESARVVSHTVVCCTACPGNCLRLYISGHLAMLCMLSRFTNGHDIHSAAGPFQVWLHAKDVAGCPDVHTWPASNQLRPVTHGCRVHDFNSLHCHQTQARSYAVSRHDMLSSTTDACLFTYLQLLVSWTRGHIVPCNRSLSRAANCSRGTFNRC